MYLYTYLDDNFFVETYFPVYQNGTDLHNVVILIMLVNDSDSDYLPNTRLQSREMLLYMSLLL